MSVWYGQLTTWLSIVTMERERELARERARARQRPAGGGGGGAEGAVWACLWQTQLQPPLGRCASCVLRLVYCVQGRAGKDATCRTGKGTTRVAVGVGSLMRLSSSWSGGYRRPSWDMSNFVASSVQETLVLGLGAISSRNPTTPTPTSLLLPRLSCTARRVPRSRSQMLPVIVCAQSCGTHFPRLAVMMEMMQPPWPDALAAVLCLPDSACS